MAQQINTNATLWQNVSALMRKHYGKENLTLLAEECGFGPATATRIKKQETSVGLDILDKIAVRFNLAVWQLLVPGFEVDHPPALQPLNEKERMLYERIMSAARQIASEPEIKNNLR